MNAWRFITLVLTALAIGAPLAHVLEMPVRRTYDPALYVTVTHTLYRYFGIAGAMIEVGAVVGGGGVGRRAWKVAHIGRLRASLGGGGSRVPGAGARPVLAPRQPGESGVRGLDAGCGAPRLDPVP